MSYSFNGTSQYGLYAGTPLVTAYGWAFAMWLKPANLAALAYPLGATKTGDDNVIAGFTIAATTGVVQMRRRTSADLVSLGTTAISAGAWSLIAISEPLQNSRKIYVNSATPETDSTDLSSWVAGNFDLSRIGFGCFPYNTGAGVFYPGLQAYAALWPSRALDDDDVTELLAGTLPQNLTNGAPAYEWRFTTDKTGTNAYAADVGTATLDFTGHAATYNGSDNPSVGGGGGSNIIRGVKGMTGGMQNLSGGTQ